MFLRDQNRIDRIAQREPETLGFGNDLRLNWIHLQRHHADLDGIVLLLADALSDGQNLDILKDCLRLASLGRDDVNPAPWEDEPGNTDHIVHCHRDGPLSFGDDRGQGARARTVGEPLVDDDLSGINGLLRDLPDQLVRVSVTAGRLCLLR